jgi:small-conductance mechanosensitive channel
MLEAVKGLHDTQLFGIPLGELSLAALVALVSYLALAVLVRVALRRLSAVAERTGNRADDVLAEVLGGTRTWLIGLVALLLGASMLDLSDRWSTRVGQLWFVVVAVQVALWCNLAVSVGLRRHAERNLAAGSTSPMTAAATLLSWGLRVLLWTIVLLAVLSNVGVNITAFIASLGVGGIAIALAAQNILGDLFASVAIALDKPFEVGDFVVLGSVAGTVELVGVKTTRIRSLGGEQIVMSNTELLKQTVSNYKRLRERRIVFTFGITYDTTPEQAEAIPALVKQVVEASEQLRFDRAHFKAFAESSLDFEVVYVVLDPAYGVYMDEQQRINLALMRELRKLGVEFAFPTRTVVIAGGPSAPD